MPVDYHKLWMLVTSKRMKKMELKERAGISTNALAKLGKNMHVSTEILERICFVLGCDIKDIVEVISEEEADRRRKGYRPAARIYTVYGIEIAGASDLEEAKVLARKAYIMKTAGYEKVDEEAIVRDFPDLQDLYEFRLLESRDREPVEEIMLESNDDWVI